MSFQRGMVFRSVQYRIGKQVYTQMISVDQIPETIHLVFPDGSENDTMLVLQLKKYKDCSSLTKIYVPIQLSD